MSDPSTLILPVESRVRELDAKLLLAAVAAERGFPVVLGARNPVSFALPSLPRGVFFAKSMRFTSDLMTGFIQGFGHHLVASDEESLVRFDHPDYYSWRFSEQTFGALRHLFAWGQDDAEMLRAYPGRGEVVVHATGNPRMDMLRQDVRRVYDERAEALRAAHGPFILVNTNFPFVNNFVPSLNLIQYPDGGEPQVSRTGRGMSLPFALDMARHCRCIADAFETLLPRLAAAFPQHTVVLRPHPSENHDHWRRLLAHVPNLQVLHHDSIVPWLMAADVLVHNGCTTAVEAAVLERPTVAYRPVSSPHHDYHLPNRVSVQVEHADAVIDAVGDAIHGRAGGCAAERDAILDRHLARSPVRLAADRIVDVLVDQGYLESPPPPTGLGRRSHAWVGTHIRTLVKKVNLRRKGHRNSGEYFRHRFPPLGLDEVNRLLARLGDTLGRFADVEAAPLGADLFEIRAGRTGR